MGKVWNVADIAVCRSGANTCAELVSCGVPSILVPYPLAADGHQEANARVLAQMGGAILVKQDELERLGQCVATVAEQLGEMRGRLERYRLGMERPTLAQIVREQLA
jgi:UDP-N-acetylglucosamine--N-acetylmuramyl-(pentapeptide) pyrophosphoryl-undecaprenol N-acetylglucosamine transferase